jgi:hypothetical protein
MNFHEGINTIEEALLSALSEIASLDYISPAKFFSDLIGNTYAFLTIGENLFVGAMPDKPDLCFCFYDTGGGMQNDRLAIDTSNVQLTGRGDYESCANFMNLIRIALQSISPMTLVQLNLVGIWIITPLTCLGRDNKNRFQFSINFKVALELYTHGNRMPGGDVPAIAPPNDCTNLEGIIISELPPLP